MKQQTHPPPQIMDDTAQKPKCTIFPSFKRVNWSLRQRKSDRKWKKKKKWNGIRTPWYKSLVGYHFPFTTVYSNHVQPNVRIHLVSVFIFQVFFVLFYSRWRSVLQTEVLGKYNSSFRWSKLPNLQIKCIENWVWDTSTRRSHSAQITSPRVVGKSCLIHRFLSPLLHEQIQIHRRYSILEKTCSCNRIKLNYQATKKKIESTRKHRRLGSKFCDRLHHNYVTCSKTKKIH